MAQKANPATRHVISINDLSDKDIEAIFDMAQAYLNELPDPHFPYRIGRSTKAASNYILAALFYEPSTRTRLSFESAMLRLGGEVLSTENAKEFSSAIKGETLEDTIRIVESYADAIVLRHYDNDASERAAKVSIVPIINA